MELEPIAQAPALRPFISNQHLLPKLILEGRSILKNPAYVGAGKNIFKIVMTPDGLFYPENEHKEADSLDKLKLEQKVRLTVPTFRLIYESSPC